MIYSLPGHDWSGSVFFFFDEEGGMMKLNTHEAQRRNETLAERIARHARALGYEADVSCSRLSGSAYVDITKDGVAVARVRLANHEERPSYAGLHGKVTHYINTTPGANGPTWRDVVVELAERAGKPVPASIRAAQAAAQTRAAKRQADLAARRKAYAESLLARLRAVDPTAWVRASKRRSELSDSKGRLAEYHHQTRTASCGFFVAPCTSRNEAIAALIAVIEGGSLAGRALGGFGGDFNEC